VTGHVRRGAAGFGSADARRNTLCVNRVSFETAVMRIHFFEAFAESAQTKSAAVLTLVNARDSGSTIR